MKYVIALLSLFSAAETFACTDLSGSYEIISNDSSLKIKIIQSGCSEVKFYFNADTPTSKYLLDQNPYFETWDADLNSEAISPITSETKDFVKAFFNGNRLTLQKFKSPFTQNNYGSCKGRYSFADSDCQMMEVSIGYSDQLGSLTWRTIGYWRMEGTHEDIEYKLRKI